jgi:hypothetical protein
LKDRCQFAKRVRKLRKNAILVWREPRNVETITANFWGGVERGKKISSLDTIVATAKGLSLSPWILLSPEREEDERDLRKLIETLLDKSTPQQLELMHKLATVLVEP